MGLLSYSASSSLRKIQSMAFGSFYTWVFHVRKDGLRVSQCSISHSIISTFLDVIVSLLSFRCDCPAYKHRNEVATDVKLIYSAATETEAEFHLELFAEKWDQQYASISKLWRTHWGHVTPLFAFPEGIRKVIYLAMHNIAKK